MVDDTARSDRSDSDDGPDPGSDDVAAAIRAARLVYGAVLVDDRPTFLECVDRNAFEDNANASLYTAFNSLGADLVPFVHETEAELREALPATVADALENDDPPRETAFDRAASIAGDARASYLLVNTEDDEWKRIRDVASDRFGESDEVSDPRLGKFVVASALVDESRERFAELPDGVDAEDVGLIQWKG